MMHLATLMLWLTLTGCDSGTTEIGNPDPNADAVVQAGALVIAGELVTEGNADAGTAVGQAADGATIYVEQIPSVTATANTLGQFLLEIPAEEGAALNLANDANSDALPTQRLLTLVGALEVNGKKLMIRQPDLVATTGSRINLGTLTLKETGAFQGRVQLSDADSHLGIDVYVPGTSFIAKTDSAGDFIMVFVPEGQYQVVAERSGYKVKELGDFRIRSRKVTTISSHVLDTDDTTAPDTSFVSTPSLVADVDFALFEFSATERGSLFTCQLDAGTPESCTSPWVVAGLAEGIHQFSVVATDAGGNVDASAAAHTWRVDITAPLLLVTDSPGTFSRDTAPSVTFGSTEDSVTFLCALDGAAAESCTSPYTAGTLAEGVHALEIIATDEAGNASVPSRISFTVDSLAPLQPSIIVDAAVSSAAVAPTISVLGATEVCLWGDVTVQTVECSDDGSTGWMSLALPISLTLSTGDGTKILSAKFRDEAGNVSDTVTTSVLLDTEAPSDATVLLTGRDRAGSSSISSRLNTVEVGITGTSGVEMLVSEDSGFPGAVWSDFRSSFPWTFSGDDGSRTLYVKLRDAAGNTSTIFTSNALTIDRAAPTVPYVTINGGAAYCTSTSATVTLNAVDATQMRISTDGDFSTVAWENYVASTTVTLPSGVGTKTVFVVFRDDAGNETSVVSDTIDFDDAEPTSPSVFIQDGDAYAASVSVMLTLSAVDADFMQISTDGTFDSEPWTAFASTATIVLPGGDCATVDCKIVSVRFRDVAGNISDIATDSITLDTTLPSAPLITTESTTVDAASVVITIASAVTETFFDRYEVMGGHTNFPSGFQSASTTKAQTSFTVNLDQDFRNTIRIRARDLAGNVSDESFTIIVEDSQDPEPPQNVNFLAGDERIRITWDPSPSSDVAYYELQYAFTGSDSTFIPNAHGAFAEQGPSPLIISAQSQTAFLAGLPNDNDVYIVVRAVDYAGHKSADPSGVSGEGSALRRPNPMRPEHLKRLIPDSAEVANVHVWNDIMFVAIRCTTETGNPLANEPNPDEQCTDTDGSLRIYSLGNPAEPVQIARCSADANEDCDLGADVLTDVRDVVFDGIYAYVAAGTKGIVVLNLSDPTAPTEEAVCRHDDTCLPSDGFAHSVRVQNGMIYVADGPAGFRTLDNRVTTQITSTSIQRCSGTTSSTCSHNTLGVGGESDADGLLANKPLTEAEYDYTTAADTRKRCVARKVEVSGHYAFVLINSSSYSSCGTNGGSSKVRLIRLIDDDSDSAADDAGDPSAFYPTSQEDIDVGYIDGFFDLQDIHVSQDLLFIGQYNSSKSLKAYYIGHIATNLENSQVYDLPIDADRITTHGPLLVVAPNQTGSQAIEFYSLATFWNDIGSAGTMVNVVESLPMVGSWGYGANRYSVVSMTAHGSLLFLGESTYGSAVSDVEIFDFETPVVPRRLSLDSTISTYRGDNIFVSNRVLGLQTEGDLHLYDVSDVDAPKSRAVLQNDANETRTAQLVWPYLYMAACRNSNSNTLRIYNLTDWYGFSDPEGANLVQTVSLPWTSGTCSTTAQRASALRVHGRYLFVGNGTQGVLTYNISNPSTPIIVKDNGAGTASPIAPYHSGAQIRDIRARGGTMYVAEGSHSGSANSGFVSRAIDGNINTTSTQSGNFSLQDYLTVSSATNSAGANRMAVWGGRLFTAISSNSSSFDDKILGCATPSSAAELAGSVPIGTQVSDTSFDGYQAFVSGRYAFSAGMYEAAIIDATGDLSDPSNMSRVVFAAPVWLADVAAYGRYVYFVAGEKLELYDLGF